MKETHGEGAGSLKGTLLAASPSLQDPNFLQTLVYLAEHSPEGALGFVMNRPLGKTLAEVALGHAELPPAIAKLQVYYGGPVRPGQIMIVVFEPARKKGIIRCRSGLPLEQVEAHATAKPEWVRVFAGYSGWGESQLEGELDDQAWTVCRPDPALFVEHLLPGLWSAYASGDERWRKLIPHLPRDPNKN